MSLNSRFTVFANAFTPTPGRLRKDKARLISLRGASDLRVSRINDALQITTRQLKNTTQMNGLHTNLDRLDCLSRYENFVTLVSAYTFIFWRSLYRAFLMMLFSAVFIFAVFIQHPNDFWTGSSDVLRRNCENPFITKFRYHRFSSWFAKRIAATEMNPVEFKFQMKLHLLESLFDN